MAKDADLSKLEPRRVVLIKPSALGDIAHSLPVLSALRRRYPAAHLAWVVNKIYEPILRNHPDLDEIVPFDRGMTKRGWFSGVAGFWLFLRELRGKSFDLAVDLQGLLRTGLMARATGAATRLGLASAREGSRWCYTHVLPDDADRMHAIDRYWMVAEAIGAGDLGKRFSLAIDPAAKAWAQAQLAPLPRPWIAVGVGARWLTKRWPPEHFAALTNQAIAAFGGSAVFVGTPDETRLAESAASAVVGPKLNVAGKTSLPQLAAILGEVDVMLGNDTGPLHLAVALGRPVVAPFTCTRVRRTGPYGPEHRALETTVWCAGSYRKTCDRLECMGELTPGRLWPPFEEVLAAWRRRNP